MCVCTLDRESCVAGASFERRQGSVTLGRHCVRVQPSRAEPSPDGPTAEHVAGFHLLWHSTCALRADHTERSFRSSKRLARARSRGWVCARARFCGCGCVRVSVRATEEGSVTSLRKCRQSTRGKRVTPALVKRMAAAERISAAGSTLHNHGTQGTQGGLGLRPPSHRETSATGVLRCRL